MKNSYLNQPSPDLVLSINYYVNKLDFAIPGVKIAGLPTCYFIHTLVHL
jgi:hypothetical protein